MIRIEIVIPPQEAHKGIEIEKAIYREVDLRAEIVYCNHQDTRIPQGHCLVRFRSSAKNAKAFAEISKRLSTALSDCSVPLSVYPKGDFESLFKSI